MVMDPSIMKLLEEDDDETLHSGADLEAFQAALNRDIAGDVSTSPSTQSDHGVEFNKQDVCANNGCKGMQYQEEISPKVGLKQNGAVPGPKHDKVSEKINHHLHQESQDNLLNRQHEQKLHHNPPATGLQASKTDSIRLYGRDTMHAPDSGNDSHYLNLQKMSNQNANLPRKLTNQTRSSKQVPFALLLPFILPQLDKDKAMQLTTLYEKLKKNDIPREEFARIMRSIVGDKMLRLAVSRADPQSHSQQKQMPIQTSAPQNLSVKQPVSVSTATFNESHPSKLLPQKRNMADIQSGPVSSIRVHPGMERAAVTSVESRSPVTELHSRTAPSTAGIDSRIPHKKPSNGLKRPIETLDSSPPAGSKKQKVSAPVEDQSIEQLIDVTAVSGVNLREEEEQLFSCPKEDGRVSEASRRAVQEEEEKLILQRSPLQKRMAQIMAKCGVKNVSKDVERCLSLGVEERIRVLLCNLIKFSKQRVDAEKQRHQTVITSDIHQQLMILNRKAKEDWTKRQAEEEKLKKLNEPECTEGDDGQKEKDETRGKLVKATNKEEEDKMRTTAANVAARAAVGGDDLLSKWQLMAEQARQKRDGGLEMASGRDLAHKPISMLGKTTITKDHQGLENGRPSLLSASGAVRKLGNNQAMASQQRVDRSISVKDVIAVLERESQMSKSTLLYHLYNRTR